MEDFVKVLLDSKNDILEIVCTYITNTIQAKALYQKGGWAEVRKHFTKKETFNHNFSISSRAIHEKLRENNIPYNFSIRSNLYKIEEMVNEKLGVNAIEYYINGKNHALRIKI